MNLCFGRGVLMVRQAALGALMAIMMCAGCGGAVRDDDRIRVAVIPMGTTHEFWKAIHAGALTASRELDVDIIWKGPLKEDDRDEQIQIVETFIAADVSAFVIAPLDDRALIRPVLEAKNRGIPTVVLDSELKEKVYESFVATDNYLGGVLAAEHLGNLVNGSGKLIMIRVLEGVTSPMKREDGFLTTIREKFPAIDILSDNQYGGITSESAYRTTENLLNRFGDEVDAIFTPNESTTFGCLRAVQDAGLAGKIVFVGFDSSEKLIEALEKRELLGLVVQNPFGMGYYGVKNAVAILRGGPFESTVDTGVTLVTPDNMHEPSIEKLLRPDLSILEE